MGALDIGLLAQIAAKDDKHEAPELAVLIVGPVQNSTPGSAPARSWPS